MASPGLSPSVIRFGQFELDVRSGELKCNGRRKRLQGQPAQLLGLLVCRAGELVSREELRKQLWPDDTFVDFDHGVNNAVNRIREALGDSAASPRYIETVPRRGYRFIAEVEARRQAPLTLVAAGTDSEGERRSRAGSRRTITLILAASAALFVAMAGIALRARLAPAVPPIHSIAVLPFANLSGDKGQDYFAEGMTDQLTTDLARIPSLSIISRTSTLPYRTTQKPLPKIARELGVDAVIEGSVVRAGNRVRITAQLVDGRSDRHLWAESFERDLSDILAVQNLVAIEIAEQIQTRFSAEEKGRLKAYASVDPRAYDAYLLGRYSLTRQNPKAMKEALAAFQQATALDPNFAPAQAGIADAYCLLVNYGALEPKAAFPQAETAARKALQLDPTLAEAHASLALLLDRYQWDWAGAEREYKTAIQLSPSYSIAHLRYARFLSQLGRHDEALLEIRRAQQLDPNSVLVASNVGEILYWARRYDEAIQQLQRALQLDPGREYTHFFLGMAYEQKHMYAEALARYREGEALEDGQQGFDTARVLAIQGERGEAEQIVRRLAREGDYIDRFYLITVYAALNEKARAFAALEQAYARRDFFLATINVDPELDGLRGDERFAQLVRRIGLPQ